MPNRKGPPGEPPPQASGPARRPGPPSRPSAPGRHPGSTSASPARQGGLFQEARKVASDVLEGEVVRVTYENDETGFRVLRVKVDGQRELATAVGVFPPAPPGSRVRATGKLEKSEQHGEQFKVETLLPVMPGTIAGLERFLASGVVKGIGPAFAKRIVEEFGEKTLDVLDHEPGRLRDVAGLGAKRADEVAKAWETHRAIGAIMIFLQSHGASPALAGRIYKRFGPRAVRVVSASPYRLALDVWGIGFKTADRIARSIGVGAQSPERAQAGVMQVLHERAAGGHVFTERRELAGMTAMMLEIDEGGAEAAIDALTTNGRVKCDDRGDAVAVYDLELWTAEQRVAARLARLLQQPDVRPLSPFAGEAIAAFEKRARVELAAAQREAVELVARSKVVVVTGGPGVGKTTIVRAILDLFDRARLKARLAAPTGRAAKRMSEATGREATTLHRLLEYDPKSRTFSRNEHRPAEGAAFVIDETSMLDLQLADGLFSALPDDARVVLVGDVDQLPSVGPGAVLRDVIASGVVPTARLTTIFRQAEGSQIVQNAHRIQRGEPPVSDEGPSGEFYVVPRKEDDAAADTIVDLVTRRIPGRFGLDPRRDIQVLTPMHRGGCGTTALNERLQAALNPEGPSVKRGTRVLRVRDKVMQLRNDYEREVFNGDVGFVVRVDEEARELVVAFDGREVKYDESDLDELVLAYATSIHKSQGSEYPAIVVPLLTQHFVMLSRNLLYTAVTRGKKLVTLVADPRAVGLALGEVRKEQRATWLAAKLRDAVRG